MISKEKSSKTDQWPADDLARKKSDVYSGSEWVAGKVTITQSTFDEK